MKVGVFVAMLISVTAADYAENKLNQGRAIFYNELGCKPTNGNSFECPDFTTTIKKDKCYLDGKEYAIGTSNDNESHKRCLADCRCIAPYSQEGFAKFSCADIECPEDLNPEFEHPGQKCILQYEKDRCCSTKSVCDAELDALATCTLQGRTFYEGQRMYPQGECYVCMCTKDFDNSTIAGNPNCEQETCNVQLWHSEDVYKGCAPIYYRNVCCPLEFRCPTTTDAVTSEGRPEEGVCKFGNLEIGIEGEINSAREDTVCRCVAPPMMECLKT